MFGLLSPSSDRRSRSKSPSGRERERSRSRSNVKDSRDKSPARKADTRDKSPARREEPRRASTRKKVETESETATESEDDRRHGSRKSRSGGDGKKSYADDRYDDRNGATKGGSGGKIETREPARVKTTTREPERAKSSKSKKYSDSESEERPSTRKSSRRGDFATNAAVAGVAAAAVATAAAASSRPSRGRGRDISDSSDSDDIPEIRPTGAPPTSKSDPRRDDPRSSGYGISTPYGYPPQPGFSQDYPAAAFPPAPAAYPETRHMSFAVADPRYATPGSFHPPNTSETDKRRGASVSVPSAKNYAQVHQFQYAQLPSDVAYNYANGGRERESERERERAPTTTADKKYAAPSDPRYASSDKKYATPIDNKYAPPADLKYTTSHESRVPGFYDPAPVEYERVRDSMPAGAASKVDKKYYDDRYDRRERKKYDSSGDDEHRSRRDPEIQTIVPKSDKSKRNEPGPKPPSKEKKDKKYHDDAYIVRVPEPPRKGSTMLSVETGQGGHRGSMSGGKPPASPLLEAYKGTYQSISPMPSALVLYKHDSDLSDLELDSESDIDPRDPNADIKRQIRKLEQEQKRYGDPRRSKESQDDPRRSRERYDDMDVRAPRGRGGERPIVRSRNNSSEDDAQVIRPRGMVDEDGMMVISPRSARDEKVATFITSTGVKTDSVSVISSATGKKSVLFYDASSDAKKIAAALQGTTRAPNVKPLIQILPGLSSDDLFALRAEYKNCAKINGQGINIAKHIKMRIPGNLGKATYATALGRWESEAFWANSWYQGGASRRELLIESLMGRSNSDIREIKNCFKDKRYADDLVKCMKAELKADKFRTAVLLALEERRMPESVPIDMFLVKRDAEDLNRALRGSGGETAMIEIIVVRSDKHLREVMRLFEVTYEINFAKEMISKSRNLVGETLAHVINGALNRPMRDALLLHQAVAETAPGKERAELLISRVVRLHWEPKHLERVKEQYWKRYRASVVSDIRREILDPIKVEENKYWAEFCVELVKSSE